MRAGIENWLTGHWYSDKPPPWYLRALEPLYRAGFNRSKAKAGRDSSRVHLDIPVVVVGNLTAGGAGKTPLVMRLCQLAVDMGLRPGIATTGYGRDGKETQLVKAGDDPRQCGDEPLMLARRTGVPVVVSSDRLEAVSRLAEMDLDLIISDDGLQKAAMPRDIELCVVDGERGFGNGHLIPAGPLREPADRLASVDFVIANGDWPGSTDLHGAHIMHMDAYVVRSVDDSKMYPVEEFARMCRSVPVNAVAGIGNPVRFFKLLDSLGIVAEARVFADHHAFRKEDFASLQPGSAIIMTEKDAVKCDGFGLDNAWYFPVEVRLPEVFEQQFKARLAELTRSVNE